MQNNFEKNVQQKMEELNLTPSAQVWDRVEMEIAPEKKKRRGIIWFFLAALLLLIGGRWWLWQPVGKPTQQLAETKAPQPKPASEKTVPTKEGVAIKKITEPAIKNDQTFSYTKEKPSRYGATHEGKESTRTTLFVAKAPSGSSVQQHNNSSSSTPVKETTGVSFGETKKEEQAPLKPEISSPQRNVAQPSITTNTLDTLTVKATPQPANLDSTINENKNKEVAPSNVDSVVKKKVAAKNWRNQITVGIGRSSYADGSLFKSFGGRQMDAFNAALGGGSPVVTVPSKPSKVLGGAAFSLGYSLAKNMGKTWELAVGLRYAYASTRQKVGDKKAADTTVQFAADKASADGFYTNTGTKDYTNRFHFVEVPVSLSFKPLVRLPLYLSMGASYARLLQTNALTFSSASNLYYQNKDNYLRSSVALFSSVQIEFFTKKKASLRTGPFMQYNVTKLRRENSDGTPHLTVIGLKTAMIF